MRFGISLVAILAITFIYVSCNRHSLQKAVVTSNKVVSGWSLAGTIDQDTHLTFNGSNKVIKEETGHEVASYRFVDDSVMITEFSKEENRVVYEFRGKLNDKSRLVSGVAVSSYVITAPDTVQHVFLYNANGALSIEKRISNSNDTFMVKYTYADKVLAKVETFTNGRLFNTKKFDYYDEEVPYIMPEETKFRKNVNGLVGASTNRLIRKVVSTGRNGKENYKFNYVYQMDRNGYAAKMISKRGKKTSVVMTFRYDDVMGGADRSVARQ